MGKAQQMAFDNAADLVDGLGAVRGHAEPQPLGLQLDQHIGWGKM